MHGHEEAEEAPQAVKSFVDSREIRRSNRQTSDAQDSTGSNSFGSDVSASDSSHEPRYLPHSSDVGATLTFDQAFSRLRQTSAFYPRDQPTSSSSSTSSAATAASKAPVPKDASTLVFVNRCQTGNPLLKELHNVSFEFREGLVPDYVWSGTNGSNCCALFLSVRYHLLHGEYLEERLERVRKQDATSYRTKVLLCLVDVQDNQTALLQINRLALMSEFTLILAWSWPEIARYLETFKAYENKSATLIKEKIESEFLPKANEVLTGVRSVNKTDVLTLLTTFGTVRNVMNASMEEMALCPGIGQKKVRQLLDAFQEPFTKAAQTVTSLASSSATSRA